MPFGLARLMKRAETILPLRWTVLPQGFTESPNLFGQALEQILQGYERSPGIKKELISAPVLSLPDDTETILFIH